VSSSEERVGIDAEVQNTDTVQQVPKVLLSTAYASTNKKNTKDSTEGTWSLVVTRRT
jgi:hypothetical protein